MSEVMGWSSDRVVDVVEVDSCGWYVVDDRWKKEGNLEGAGTCMCLVPPLTEQVLPANGSRGRL